MNTRWAVAGAVATIISVGAGSAAGADPKGNAETFICNGAPTTIVVAGRSGFLNGVHYHAHNVVQTGTFDPTGPAPAVETYSDTKWTSGRTGGLQCMVSGTETTPEGVFTDSATFNAIPVGN